MTNPLEFMLKSRKLQKRSLEWILFLIIILSIWQAMSFLIHNALICPTPFQVGKTMLQQFQSPTFWPTILATVSRALFSLALSLSVALPIAFLGAFNSWCGGFFNRLVSVIQTVPNVSYIVLLLFWTNRKQTIILTGFFLLFPLIYRTLYEALCEIQEKWKEVWQIYPQPKRILMGKICFPLLRFSLVGAIKNASSLSFKSCVTSEILTGLSIGIGKKMQMARLDLDLASVAGWSIWLIILVFIFEKFWSFFIDHLL